MNVLERNVSDIGCVQMNILERFEASRWWIFKSRPCNVAVGWRWRRSGPP